MIWSGSGGDDWMNPQTGESIGCKPHPDGRFYLIERKSRLPVAGNVAFIEQWRHWAEFDTKEARDAELKRLRETTSWHLRGRQTVYIGGQEMPSHDPAEYMDD